MTIRLEMSFDSVEEMLSMFQTKILPVTVSVAEAPVAKETAKAPKQPKAEKPAATQAAPVTATPAPVESAPTAPVAESPSDNSVKITLEHVRAKLAEISQSGKAAQVKALLTEFGASTLSSVPAEKYAELLNKAAAL